MTEDQSKPLSSPLANSETSIPPIEVTPVVDNSWYYFFTHQTGGMVLIAIIVLIIIGFILYESA
jgi:hypothetical protein